MANKLAGQRAKFSRARATFYGASDEKQCRRAIELMAEVLVAAPANGFSEDLVTQDEVQERPLIADLFRSRFTGLLGSDLDRPVLRIADLSQRFQCHVSSADGPLVVLL